MELVEFLLARIAEDEAAARSAAAEVAELDRVMCDDERPWQWQGWSRPGASLAASSKPIGSHIARWDPIRALAECEAKRRIVEFYAGSDPDDQPVMHYLVLPYADHPDRREEWWV